MQTDLSSFVSHLMGVIAMTLVPVIFTAFVSMPLSLNRHPGERMVAPSPSVAAQHMT